MTLAENLVTVTENQLLVKKAGYDKGFAEGSTPDISWDDFSNGGKRTSYDKAFLNWDSEEIAPPYKITPIGKCTELFHGCTALKRIEPSSFDLSQADYFPNTAESATYGTFWLCRELEVIPDIGLQPGYYANTYAACMKAHTIEMLRVNEDCKFSVTAFVGCLELQNIEEIEGTIGQDFFILGCPKLSPETLKRIIKHLKDLYGTGDEYKRTLYVYKTAWDALEAEGFNDEDKAWYENWLGEPLPDGYNWFFAVFDLCWNLTLQE